MGVEPAVLIDVSESVRKALGPLVLEIHLVGGRLTKTTGDVDIAVVSTKHLDRYNMDEYVALIGVEEDLTKKHGMNVELFVRTPEDFEERSRGKKTFKLFPS